MTLTETTQRAMQIREKHADFDRLNYGRAWTDEEIMIGFVGDVGDLAKLVLAQNKVRNIDDFRTKLAHELSDCLWSVLVMAELYEIDLEQSFSTTMGDLEAHLVQKGIT